MTKHFRPLRPEFVLFLLLWLSYAYFYQSSQHNEAARFDQVRALLEDGKVTIDRFAYNTADVVVLETNGEKHVYPAKAPGTTLLGTGPFWLVSLALRQFDLRPALHWHLVAYLTTLLTVGLLSAVSGVVMFRLLLSMTADPRSSVLGVIAVWLGSISFPFSTVFFSHQQVAAQFVFAFAILFNLRKATVPAHSFRTAGLLALAGFLVGFSVTSEYPSVLLGSLLTLYLLFRLWHLDALPSAKVGFAGAFAFGAALGLVPLVIYNLAAFGRLVYTAYNGLGAGGGDELFRQHSQGFVGIKWPGLEPFLDVLAEITVRPLRGLLYLSVRDGGIFACSPVLWVAVPGLAILAARRTLRAEAALCAAMITVYFTFNACYGNSIAFWGGGASVGPRHIIPVLPFVAIPLTFGLRRSKVLFYPLLMVSVFYMLLATAVEPRTPYRPENPWSGLYLPAYLEGRFALAEDGLFYPGEKVTSNSTAFNLAKLAGVPGSWQLAPLMLVWFLLGSQLLKTTGSLEGDRSIAVRRPPRIAIGALAVYTTLTGVAPAIFKPGTAAHLMRMDRIGDATELFKELDPT